MNPTARGTQTIDSEEYFVDSSTPLEMHLVPFERVFHDGLARREDQASLAAEDWHAFGGGFPHSSNTSAAWSPVAAAKEVR